MPESPCVKPVRGPIAPEPGPAPAAGPHPPGESLAMPTARIGQTAPDFEATAFIDGGFTNIKLSDYFGHWIALCFYPGDFTFV